MLPAIHCPTSTAGLCITALQCLNLAAFANEKQAPTGYSKFAPKSATMPSRTGMLIIYSPALVTSAAMLATAPAINGREALVAGMLVVHYAKRVFETAFVHRYSGMIESGSAYFISIFYSLIALLIGLQTQNVPASVYAGAPGALLPVALGMYVVGQLGNAYHHLQLSNMRRPPAAGQDATPTVEPTPATATATAADDAPPPASPVARGYAVPRGGLFECVAAPHYLFEILAWAGLALATQQLNALLVAAGMASYLAGRAVASTKWYVATFGAEYPASRRHLVPFLF